MREARAVFHVLLLRTSLEKEIIEKDIERWIRVTRQPELLTFTKRRALVSLIWGFPEFRNVFYYRIGKDRRFINRFVLELAKLTYKPIDTLYIWTKDIGPGLFIQHGFSTIIYAKSIGENCWINQQVTIGYANVTDTPTIGDNVEIFAGAKVFGQITIGDNCKVGANAVVFKSVPPNCTVVGVPAYIVRRDGRRVKEALK